MMDLFIEILWKLHRGHTYKIKETSCFLSLKHGVLWRKDHDSTYPSSFPSNLTFNALYTLVEEGKLIDIGQEKKEKTK